MKVTCPLHVTPCHLAQIYQHFSKVSTYWTATLWLSCSIFSSYLFSSSLLPLCFMVLLMTMSAASVTCWRTGSNKSLCGHSISLSLLTFSNPFTPPNKLLHMYLLLHQKNARNNHHLNLDQASSMMEQMLRVLWTTSYGTQTIIYC